MRLSRFLSVAGLVTFLSLLYVYQQTQILRFAYAGQKKATLAEDLLDKNNILRYNISEHASLVRIGSKFSGGSDFQMPGNRRLVRLVSVKGRLSANPQDFVRKESMLSRLFGIKRQAEAKTINR